MNSPGDIPQTQTTVSTMEEAAFVPHEGINRSTNNGVSCALILGEISRQLWKYYITHSCCKHFAVGNSEGNAKIHSPIIKTESPGFLNGWFNSQWKYLEGRASPTFRGIPLARGSHILRSVHLGKSQNSALPMNSPRDAEDTRMGPHGKTGHMLRSDHLKLMSLVTASGFRSSLVICEQWQPGWTT